MVWNGANDPQEYITHEEQAGIPDKPLYMVFDVESVGLHGEGFAVGYILIDADGAQYEVGRYACPLEMAAGDEEGRRWVVENCPVIPATHTTATLVRERFWRAWLAAKALGAVLVADCAWPVEARFLAACVDDDPEQRAWEGPYPLHELASFMVAAGMDPMATHDRLPDEPLHDPLGDARQSARLLVRALQGVGEYEPEPRAALAYEYP